MLSEMPGGGPTDRGVELLSNLFHIPLFAGLTWCLLMSLCGGRWNRVVSGPLYILTGLLAGAYAAVDELHQSYQVGRFASVGDFLLDCTGICGLLLLHRITRRSRTSV